MKLTLTLTQSATVMWLALVASSQAQLSIHYDFVPGFIVSDNGQLSLAYDNSGSPFVQRDLGGLSGLTSITDVNVRMNLTTGTPGNPMFLGDMYSSLTFGNTSETQRVAVLLNRPGRDDTNAFGSSLTTLNVTLDDSTALTNVWSATGNGTFNADGRLSVNPNAAGVAYAAGSEGLADLNGASFASNRVSLLVADYSTGGVATLSGWGISTTGVAASSGTFTPGADASLSDTGSGDTNTVGAILSTTGASGGSLVLNFAGTTTFANGVTGTAGITKTGTGTVSLSGTSNYSGATTISAGVLAVNSTGTINTTSGITVAAGAKFLYDGSTALTVAPVLNGTGISAANRAVLGGVGAINTAVTLNNLGDTLSPGSSPRAGIQNYTTDQAWASFSYDWEVNNFTGTTAGTDFDQVGITGTLNLSGGSGSYILNVISLTAGDVGGTVPNFSEINRTWTVLSSSGTLSGFDADNWTINTADFTNPNTGSWALAQSGNDLVLSYTAIPEPQVALLGSLGVLALLRRRRK